MTNHIDEPILLVGSIPGDTAEEVMSQWGGGLGTALAALPDGEVGDRRAWITILAYRVFDGHPALETLRHPLPLDPSNPDEWRDPEGDWIPLSYEDDWLFKIKEGVDTIRFESIAYGAAAVESHETFKRLRDRGIVAPGLRFQISLPLHESAMRVFLTGADDLKRLWEPYGDAMKRELDAIFTAIPARELSIQWDVCTEMLAHDPSSRQLFPWEAHGEPLERYTRSLADLSPAIPEESLLGVHLCYGDLAHRHMVEPQDLAYCVELANASFTNAGRRLDFVHMPVPRDRDDDAYFQPLKDLQIGNAKLYLGLIHTTGGMSGNERRLATAKRYADEFGIATECGFGRRPREQMPELLQIHRSLATQL